MSANLLESGLRKVAQALIVMHKPNSKALEHLLDEVRLLGQDSARLEREELSRAAHSAEEALREVLAAPTEDAHARCVRGLVELGQVLLLDLAADVERPVPMTAQPSMERRLLVVDDSRVSAVAISKAFSTQGFLVRSVATMADALAELTTFMPSVLVSDVHMPELDVGVLSRNFRALSRERPTILVLISGTSGAELELRLDEVKPDAFVSKMAGTGSVVDCVMKLWAERGGAPAKA
jgi:two-component system, chemotaxis family, chemotaxis protein CheY